MTIWLTLILGAYFLGSVPAAYVVARLARDIDLRQYGTGQVGGGNLWRMTSWRFGLPVGAFDFSKGLLMVWAAQAAGLDIAQQIAVGLAVVIGHNWSVFLRFSGGRGVATAIGVILILPVINDLTPWVAVAFLTVLVTGVVLLHSSALPILLGTAVTPLVSLFYEPLSVTIGFLAIFLIIVTKRLTAPKPEETTPTNKRRLLLYRLLFDRDIGDRKAWMYRSPPKTGDPEPAGRKKG
ncbi:MAG: hypothetical protein CL874_05025 [Dehalococcoidales bacterium]|jgi:glycerol-3-phosphate acyltransferase PlsY|nr:hypothetical protein [Dehalococcoidales bacterium]MDP6825206.1 glycerol-3-phosphate acyltransferase [Dehalococcoidales bacterium]|tara:strand:- start:957 stop:1667 length:711 start_codon:yes stop_codon:yes gene_type:complete